MSPPWNQPVGRLERSRAFRALPDCEPFGPQLLERFDCAQFLKLESFDRRHASIREIQHVRGSDADLILLSNCDRIEFECLYDKFVILRLHRYQVRTFFPLLHFGTSGSAYNSMCFNYSTAFYAGMFPAFGACKAKRSKPGETEQAQEILANFPDALALLRARACRSLRIG